MGKDLWQQLLWCLAAHGRQGDAGTGSPWLARGLCHDSPGCCQLARAICGDLSLHGSGAVNCGHRWFRATWGKDMLGIKSAWQVNRFVFAEGSSEQSKWASVLPAAQPWPGVSQASSGARRTTQHTHPKSQPRVQGSPSLCLRLELPKPLGSEGGGAGVVRCAAVWPFLGSCFQQELLEGPGPCSGWAPLIRGGRWESPAELVLSACELQLSTLLVLPAIKAISTPISYPDFPWMSWAALLFSHEFPSEEISPVLKRAMAERRAA